MTPQEEKEIIEIIDARIYGEVIIKKEAGKIVHVKYGDTILWQKRKNKLSE